MNIGGCLNHEYVLPRVIFAEGIGEIELFNVLIREADILVEAALEDH